MVVNIIIIIVRTVRERPAGQATPGAHLGPPCCPTPPMALPSASLAPSGAILLWPCMVPPTTGGPLVLSGPLAVTLLLSGAPVLCMCHSMVPPTTLGTPSAAGATAPHLRPPSASLQLRPPSHAPRHSPCAPRPCAGRPSPPQPRHAARGLWTWTPTPCSSNLSNLCSPRTGPPVTAATRVKSCCVAPGAPRTGAPLYVYVNRCSSLCQHVVCLCRFAVPSVHRALFNAGSGKIVKAAPSGASDSAPASCCA